MRGLIWLLSVLQELELRRKLYILNSKLPPDSRICHVLHVCFDSHNHLQSPRFGESAAELVQKMKEVGITGCVVNATRECDWSAVAGLAREFPEFVVPAYGIHPWFADTAEPGWEVRLRVILEADPLATIGEIGVDGWVDSPGMDVQREVFVKQVEIAAEKGRVMTVHCLKAWDELFSVIAEVPEWPGKFLMHSFGGSIEIAERLLKLGAWFSFSGYFLHDRKAKVMEVFQKLPKDRILLETDAPEMMPPELFVEFPLASGFNHPANLRAIAAAFERKMGAPISEQLHKNSRDFWGAA